MPYHPAQDTARVPGLAVETLLAIAMTIGRGPAAQAVIAMANLNDQDRVVDLGCGPGTAVRAAARLTPAVTGIDPSTAALRIARLITNCRRLRTVRYLAGCAEQTPLEDGAATVVWSISAVHHWHDLPSALTEIYRILVPGGRVLLAERSTIPGSRGHAAHGITPDQASDLLDQLRSAGFVEVALRSVTAGRRELTVVLGQRPAH